MGLLGGLLLLGGISTIILGIIGVVVNLWAWDLPNAGYSALLALGGVVSGTIAATILE